MQRQLWLRCFSDSAQVPTKLAPGLVYELVKAFSQSEVDAFLTSTGDTNRFHCDDEAARKQGFKGAIMPGMLCASLFPAVVARAYPGAVYASQELRFLKPVLVNEYIHAKVEVQAVTRSKVTFVTTCLTADGKETITGKAVAIIKQT